MSKSNRSGKTADEALSKAAGKGDLEGVQQRIAAGADVNAAAKREAPALYPAISSGKLEVVQALIAAGADLNKVAYPTSGSSVCSTPLCYAIDCEQWSIADALVSAGADLAVNPYGDDNAVGTAANKAERAYRTLTTSDEEWLGSKRTKAVMDKAKVTDEWTMNFIRHAIGRGVKVRDYWMWNSVGHKELALMLIAAGVNLNAAPHGSSALVASIERGHDEVAIALIKAGADVNTPKKIAPILLAARKTRMDVLAALVEGKADINVTGDVTLGDDAREVKTTDANGIVKTQFVLPEVAEESTALIVAVRMGHRAVVEFLIKHKADLNRPDQHGLNALGWALKQGNSEIIALLRSAGGSEPEFAEGAIQTALFSAAKEGDVAKLESVLQRGADPNKPIEDREGKRFPLVSAAREGRIETVELLIRRGADVNVAATENWTAGATALMAAARNNHVQILKALLSAGADVHAKDAGFEDGGETALHYAARGGHVEAIQVLVEAGSKINAKAKGGSTPLVIALQEKKHAAVTGLIELGADPNAGPSDGSGPLFAAASAGDAEMVKLLLAHGAKPIPSGKKADFRALDIAASQGAVEIVRLLIKAGAPVDAPNVVGSTALSGAAIYGREEIVKILIEAGANPNSFDRDGNTPLMAAVRSGKVALVKLLLEANADVHAATNEGKTALTIAKERKSKEILSLIETATEQKPAGKIVKKAAQRAKKQEHEEEEDEDFEEPDFSDAAKTTEFKAALREVEKLCNSKSEKLSDVEGGYSFTVPRALAEKVLADHHQPLKGKGAYLFRHHRDLNDVEDKLGLLPTKDWSDLIRTFQTNGANYDLMPVDIARWLDGFAKKYPIVVTGAGFDWLEGRITGPVKNSRKLAHEMYEFCPDIVDQGIGSVKDLARALEKDGYFFFWWD